MRASQRKEFGGRVVCFISAPNQIIDGRGKHRLSSKHSGCLLLFFLTAFENREEKLLCEGPRKPSIQEVPR